MVCSYTQPSLPRLLIAWVGEKGENLLFSPNIVWNHTPIFHNNSVKGVFLPPPPISTKCILRLPLKWKYSLLSKLHRDLVLTVTTGIDNSFMECYKVLQGSESFKHIKYFVSKVPTAILICRTQLRHICIQQFPLKESCQVPTLSEVVVLRISRSWDQGQSKPVT